jgi:hypothetical protein
MNKVFKLLYLIMLCVVFYTIYTSELKILDSISLVILILLLGLACEELVTKMEKGFFRSISSYQRYKQKISWLPKLVTNKNYTCVDFTTKQISWLSYYFVIDNKMYMINNEYSDVWFIIKTTIITSICFYWII